MSTYEKEFFDWSGAMPAYVITLKPANVDAAYAAMDACRKFHGNMTLLEEFTHPKYGRVVYIMLMDSGPYELRTTYRNATEFGGVAPIDLMRSDLLDDPSPDIDPEQVSCGCPLCLLQTFGKFYPASIEEETRDIA